MRQLKKLLPDFPRTPHLPYKVNAVPGDIIAENIDALLTKEFSIEEKIDGSNAGMALVDGEVVIRNRKHILSKGYVKETAAKKQFASIWNWFYDNKTKFQKLDSTYPGLTIYGEWTVALHGIRYDKLPAYFIAYDLYDWTAQQFLAAKITRQLLQEAGFIMPPLLFTGKLTDLSQLDHLCDKQSEFSSLDKLEGLYLKVSDHKFITERFKMVRSDYVQGERWHAKHITKNKLA